MKYLFKAAEFYQRNSRDIFVFLIMATIVALASLANEVLAQQDHTCQGGFNCNEGGGSGEQTQTSTQSNVIGIENTSVAGAVSGSDATVILDVSNGGDHISNSTGQSSSRSESNSGDSEATGGVSNNDIQISTGGGIQEEAASSAATVFAGYCTSGASGQISGGGFSVSNPSQFCDFIRMAAVMLEAHNRENHCTCEGVCTAELATVEMSCTTTPEGEQYLADYHWNLQEAQNLLRVTATTGKIDRITSQLLKTIALVALLIAV